MILYLIDTSLLSMEAGIVQSIQMDEVCNDWEIKWFTTIPSKIVSLGELKTKDIEEDINFSTLTSIFIISDLTLSKVDLSMSNRGADRIVEQFSAFFKLCSNYKITVTMKCIYSRNRVNILHNHRYLSDKLNEAAIQNKVTVYYNKLDISSQNKNGLDKYNEIANKLSQLYNLPIYNVIGILKSIMLNTFIDLKVIKTSVIICFDVFEILNKSIKLSNKEKTLLINDIVNSDLFIYDDLEEGKMIPTKKALDVLAIAQSQETTILLSYVSEILYRHHSSLAIELIVNNFRYDKYIECNRISVMYNRKEIPNVLLRELSNIIYIEDGLRTSSPREQIHLMLNDLLMVQEHIVLLNKTIVSSESLNLLYDIINYTKYLYYKYKLQLLIIDPSIESTDESIEVLEKRLRELEKDSSRLTSVESDIINLHSIVEC